MEFFAFNAISGNGKRDKAGRQAERQAGRQEGRQAIDEGL